MRRIMLIIAYDGTDYVGWQMQPNGIAVEQVINKALSELRQEMLRYLIPKRAYLPKKYASH